MAHTNVFRPRKADKGHTAVRYEVSGPDFHGNYRTTIVCQCGRRMSGGGRRSFYAHQAHQRDLGII